MSVVCQAEPWTGRYTVEPEQNGGFPNQRFSIKRDRLTLPVTPLDIVDTCGHEASASLSDNKRHRQINYGVKTTIIGSISWQRLYATNLLVACELILTTKGTLLNSNFYSWLPVELVVVWLLKSYWSPHSPLFKPIERQTGQIHTFAAITTAPDSGDSPSQSASADQQAPPANASPTGSFTGFLYSDSAGGNGDPQQHQHTLGLDCFVSPCNGVCRYRLSYSSREPSGWLLNSVESSTGYAGISPKQSSCPHLANGYCFGCVGHFNPVDTIDSPGRLLFGTLNVRPEIQLQCYSGALLLAHSIDGNTANSYNFFDGVALDGVALDGVALHSMSAEATSTNATTGPFNNDWPIPDNSCFPPGGSPPGGSPPGGTSYCQKALPDHKKKDNTGQTICDKTLVGENGLRRLCGIVCKNAKFLTDHNRRYHSSQKACDVNVIGEDGRLRPCGKICKHARGLSSHKTRQHSGQKTCSASVVGEDGQHRPCGMVCKNAQALSDHKRRYHSGLQTCSAIEIGENGQARLCGKAIKNLQALAYHKRVNHTGQQTCNVTLVGKDGRQQLCGKVCKNAKVLSSHKNRDHSGQKTCGAKVVGEDGLQRSCGMVCKSTRTLSNHKKRIHGGPETCSVTVVGEDEELRLCGKVCNSAQALTAHRRIHRKRRPVDEDQ
ncbi:hypothetical protein [Endozoicomonas sp. 8E]|uniref:hypothetical protein n=1 Tax=Endozoicomonas sp. 8E TaxID=3035692 RepID=UPI002938E572|nr:hypothetical protein [Endozoicomonas sp. 8E]WOG27124.1 hypothetical protein P6910_21615 [Endozoicomonas sp. 8E]